MLSMQVQVSEVRFEVWGKLRKTPEKNVLDLDNRLTKEIEVKYES